MSNALISLYSPINAINGTAADVKQGLATADDFRFLRLAWEVAPGEIGLHRIWPRLAKGGEYSPFFDDVHLSPQMVVVRSGNRSWGRGRPQNSQYFGSAGVTWPRRTTSPFGPRVFPEGCAFSDKGPAGIPRKGYSPSILLGLLTSRPSRLLLSVRLGAGDSAPGSASKSYEVGLIPYAFRIRTFRRRQQVGLRC